MKVILLFYKNFPIYFFFNKIWINIDVFKQNWVQKNKMGQWTKPVDTEYFKLIKKVAYRIWDGNF